MEKAYQTRIVAITLAVVTLAVCVLAGLNFAREGSFDLPTDGVRWTEDSGGLRALRVPMNSPAERAGIRPGDLLIEANDHRTERLSQLERELFRSGSWVHVDYTILRSLNGDPSKTSRVPVQVIPEPTDRSINTGFRLIALVYLSIGLYVLFRRWTAPKATHFYLFCLASCVLYAFKYTGQLDGLDWTFYWGNLVAQMIQPALFLHFAITFGESANLIRRRVLRALLYVPGIVLLGVQVSAIEFLSATDKLRHYLDQLGIGYLATYYVIAAIVFVVRYRSTVQPLERQQLKWLTRGTLLSVIPFTLLYVLPYLFDLPVPSVVQKIAGLTLVFLPLTFSWAIVRYRLMDTDLIFKRGVTYTLATAALVGVYFAIVAVSAEVVHTRLPNLRVWGLLAAIIATALIFEPIKVAIQARVDRIFDAKKFDYRETLMEFSRGLSSETDLKALAESIADKLSQSLLVSRLAVFLAPQEGDDGFTLTAYHGLPSTMLPELERGIRHASFLRFDDLSEGHRFFENPQNLLRLQPAERSLAAMLDMNYFLPCRVAGRGAQSARAIAVLGIGRTEHDDFLSSEDMELLESLAGYIAIAIQNAQLFHSLESKISEFERLKEFNENIVESIKVGIFTLDLDDRIESWNAEMEVLYALPRAEVLGQPIAEVFPAAFVSQFEQSKADSGTTHLSKIHLQLQNGETRNANIAIAPLLTRDFVTVGRIVLLDDITDRMELESQLAQAEKLSSIGLLAAGVAHEVNTPLTVISSYTQMLTKHAREDTRLTMALEKITQQTFRASEIVNGLLNFSRKTAAEYAPIDVNALVRETATLLEHQFRSARIKVDLQLDAALPQIVGSRGKLQQVILNLMMNARDAMLERPTTVLTVRSVVEDDQIALCIQDTGIGIESANLNRIYDPFFTTKNAPKEGHHKGTGLGLAVSYGIIQDHGGRIRVESEVGVGTTFVLEFPLVATKSTEIANEKKVHV